MLLWGRMSCKVLIDEKEESGWVTLDEYAEYDNPNITIAKSGQILFRKPDDSPARKFQIFLVGREGGTPKQITRGVEEVTNIISVNSRWFLAAPADLYLTLVGSSVGQSETILNCDITSSTTGHTHIPDLPT